MAWPAASGVEFATPRHVWERAVDTKDLSRGIRATIWPALKAHGFTDRTERVAWRYVGDDIDVVELQAVGQGAEAVGCPPLSLSVIVAAYPRFMPRERRIPERDGKRRPHYWHCDPYLRFMTKMIAQPWFSPFNEPSDRGMLPSLRLHRDALKTLVDPKVHDRPDTWYMREDGSNLDENLFDMTRVLLSTGLDLLDTLHDPRQVLALIDSGSLLSPTSPRARDLRMAIESYLAGGFHTQATTPSEPTG